VERAAKIALGEITSFLASGPTPERIRMVCFDPTTLGAYQDAFGIR
jgi:O-acetyl-ADP-ribose deacetylase (regulator of RNase III)